MKKNIFKILRICGYLIGFSVLLYPAISNYLNQRNATTVATDYEQEVSHLSEEEEARIIEEAVSYNQSLIGGSSILDPFAEDVRKPEDEHYNSLLSIGSGGMMGYIELPKIKILLPIYHGTSESVLQSGAGHLENTSLPVGGESSHSVLSAHRGLPSAKLFTDLNKMELGDVFYIKVLHHTFAYQVDQILTVEPTETDALMIEEGKDYVTLVTCTPYAVNTHRLLVRGTRIPYEEALEITDEMELKAELPLYVKALIGAAAVLLLIYGIVRYINRNKRTGRKRRGRRRR